MSKGTRLFLLIAGIVMLVTTVTVVGASVALYSAGSIKVDVRQQAGPDISLKLPVGIVKLAMRLVPRHVIPPIPVEVRRVEQALRILRDSPDFIVVEVQSGDQEVLVRMVDGQLVVDVAEGRDKVHVSVPLDTFIWVMGRLDAEPIPI